MSDKFSKGSGKNEIKRFHDLKGGEIKSASTPPPLPPSRTGNQSYQTLKTPEKQPLSPTFTMNCPKCGDSTGECPHLYEELAPINQRSFREVNHYEPLQTPPGGECDLNTRLRKIEDNQTRMRGEFNSFRDTVSKEMESLHATMKSLMETCDSLDESMRDSFGYLHLTMDKKHSQLLENSDHLGKQIIDVKRVIQELTKQQPKLSSGGFGSRKKNTHSFEWEVGNLDSMVKHQKSSSSQSYLIGQVDFKILGGAVCSRDGRLCVRIYGDFTHMPMNSWERKNGEFVCAVYLVDKMEEKPDLLVGRIVGDLNKEKEWAVGEVPACDIKLNGYSAKGGNINLKFEIDVFE